MKIVKAGYEIMTDLDGKATLEHIERCGRVCYKSEDKITNGTAKRFVTSIVSHGHESVLEHANFSVRFIVDRGVSHELVRHRIASFSQESTRYCNYSKDGFGSEITVIEPCYLAGTGYGRWEAACRQSEQAYFDLLNRGCTAQEARSVLPNSLKTEVVMTCNLREWRHFFKLRCSGTAHPQMREVATPLLMDVARNIPVVFDDVVAEVHG